MPAISSTALDGLRRVATEARASVGPVLAAGIACALRVHLPARHLGAVVDGNRDRKELRRSVGLFISPVPLAMDMVGHGTFREVVHSVNESWRAGFEHRAPFERIHRMVGDEAPERVDLPFDWSVNYVPRQEASIDVPASPRAGALRITCSSTGLHSVRLSSGGARGTYSRLDFQLTENAAGGLDGHVVGNALVSHPATLAAMGERASALLVRLAEHPDARLEALLTTHGL
jgi:non-ribosomal peptide synthetase component F